MKKQKAKNKFFDNDLEVLHDSVKILDKDDASIIFSSDMDNHKSLYKGTWEEDWYDCLQDTFKEVDYQSYSVYNDTHGKIYFILFSIDNIDYQISFGLIESGFYIELEKRDGKLYKDGYFRDTHPLDVSKDVLDMIAECIKKSQGYFRNHLSYRIRFLSGIYDFQYRYKSWEKIIKNTA